MTRPGAAHENEAPSTLGSVAEACAGAAGAAGVLARCAAVMRRIIGAPDYAAYVAHVRTNHPDREPLGEAAFVAERLRARYERPGSRCC